MAPRVLADENKQGMCNQSTYIAILSIVLIRKNIFLEVVHSRVFHRGTSVSFSTIIKWTGILKFSTTYTIYTN